MRNKLAKALKKDVMLKMYLGDGVTAEDIMKDRKSVYASPEFKPVYRARKINHKKVEQVVNHMSEEKLPSNEVCYNMMKVRKKREAARSLTIQLRKKKRN